MKPFKFLNKNKTTTFPYEMTGRIQWFPASLMNSESWNTNRSNLIKGWLEDFFDGMDHETVKYFPDMDRTCRIIQTGLDTFRNQRVFTAKIWIMRHPNEYMEIDLSYPLI